jgi:predicted enzyme related to lactoylglutathione lyase
MAFKVLQSKANEKDLELSEMEHSIINQVNSPVLESIGVIFRHVEDLEHARTFYGETLGLQLVWQAPDGATAYSSGSGPIIILSPKSDRIEGRTQFNFETPDISQAYRSMRDSGVEVGEIKIAGETSMFFYQDPEGNTMMVWACHLPDPELPQYREEVQAD